MTRLSLAEAQANLSNLVEAVLTTHERFELTRNGERVAVLLGADDYDSLLETLDILSSPDEVEAIRTGLAEVEHGQLSSADEVRAALTGDRGLPGREAQCRRSARGRAGRLPSVGGSQAAFSRFVVPEMSGTTHF